MQDSNDGEEMETWKDKKDRERDEYTEMEK